MLDSIQIPITINYEFGEVTIDYYGTYMYGAYTCKINELKVSSDNYFIKEVNGSHEGLKTNSEISQFYIDNNDKLQFLPKNIFKHFSNLEAFKIYGSGLLELKKPDFENADKLKILLIVKSSIKLLNEELFLNAKNLIFILK